MNALKLPIMLAALLVAIPAIADAAGNARTAPEIRAARKHHMARPSSLKSFAAYPGGERIHPSFGYGVGDNSRNQTW